MQPPCRPPGLLPSRPGLFELAIALFEDDILQAVELVEKLRSERDAALAELNAVRNTAASSVADTQKLRQEVESLRAERKQVRVEMRRQPQPVPHVEIRVLDRGLGVPNGCEEKIFEQFYRAHDSLSSGIQGSGLGLTLARQIARAHGGDVVCEPREGGGTCFTLRLPAAPISTTNEHE